MSFHNREEAGKRLAEALKEFYQAPDTLIIALPRGGVVLGYEIAKALDLSLDICCPRKIGAPENPELAIGAVTETGEAIFLRHLIAIMHIPQDYLQNAVEKEKQEAQRRLTYFRGDLPPRHLEHQTVILVDDGLATGATMRAAIKTARASHAKKVILAVPVAPPDTLEALKSEVDQIFCLLSPPAFYAVGQFYEHFEQTTDAEVIALLKKRNTRYHS